MLISLSPASYIFQSDNGSEFISEFIRELKIVWPMLVMVHGKPRHPQGSKKGNVLFNDVLNTFYLRLYGVRHMVKDHSDSERGNLLPPHRLLFPISSKGSFICIIPQTG